MWNEVIVLFNGYSYPDSEDASAMRANCSCTLVKGIGNYNVIVDTLTPWDRDKILEALKTHGVKPEDITAVVNTHGHSDHIGNNNLFPNAERLIVGECVSIRDKYLTHNFKNPFKLTESISVMATAGHTQTCVSVIVKNTNLGGTVGICGDLFENEQDINDCSIWLSSGSEDPDKQRSNRYNIASLVDYIVPGHGKLFNLNDEIRKKLKSDLENA